MRTDAQGNGLWTKVLGGTDWEYGRAAQQTKDSGYVIAGQTNSFGAGSWDVYPIKTNAGGDTVWTKTFGGVGSEDGLSVLQTADGGYVTVGYTESFGAGGRDVYLIKTDSLGMVSAVAGPKASPTRASAVSLTCEPNPFRARTAISLLPTASSPAELAVFDVSGRCVRTLTANRTSCAVWDGKDGLGQPLPSGTYFVRIDVGNEPARTRVGLQR